MEKIAYLGLGTMGRAMAQNLLAAGFDVTVWNRTPERCAPLVARGAHQAESPSDAVAGVDVVLYSLGSEQATAEVVFGERGVLRAARRGQIAVDMATCHPAISRRQAEAYEARGADFLDAPVFGSRAEAEAGKLCVLVGGKREVLDRVRPVLAPLGESVHHMGVTGSGASTGLVGSLIVALQLEALSEAMVLATRAGLDARKVLEVIDRSDFRSPILAGMGAGILARDFAPVFALKHLLKDANDVARLARDLDVPVPASDVARELVEVAVTQGIGEENASALIKVLEGRVGVTVRG